MAGPLRPRWVKSNCSRNDAPEADATQSAATPARSLHRTRSDSSKSSGTSAGRVGTSATPNCVAMR